MKALVFVVLVGCGGATNDASEPCVETEYGCSFCVADAAPGVCGNIARYTDDGGIDFGCCVGATPLCSNGDCIQQ